MILDSEYNFILKFTDAIWPYTYGKLMVLKPPTLNLFVNQHNFISIFFQHLSPELIAVKVKRIMQRGFAITASISSLLKWL